MRVLIADDHRLVRDGLRAILDRADIPVVAEASDGHEALRLAHGTHPTVAVVDVSMPGLNGIDATKRIIQELPATKVIGLSICADQRYAVAMFRAGAVGYLLKSSAAEELIQALHAVSKNMTYVSPSIAAGVIHNVVTPLERITPDRPLSLREREVLQLIAEGKSSKEVASALSLAVATVETHRRQIMDKLGIRTIAQLTKFAIREGITSLE